MNSQHSQSLNNAEPVEAETTLMLMKYVVNKSPLGVGRGGGYLLPHTYVILGSYQKHPSKTLHIVLH